MHEIHQNISACSGQWVRWVILSVTCIKYTHTHTHTHIYIYSICNKEKNGILRKG